MCDVHIGVRDEAVTLRAVISTVFSTLEIDEVLAGIVDIATESTGSHACLIYLVDGDRLVLAAASPVHREFVGRIEMGFDEGLTGWAARHNRAALVRDGAMDDPRMRYFPELEEERWQSITAVPIPSRAGDVIGVIVLHAEAPREFTEDDVELLTHMATLVGGGIEDAQRFDEARSRVTALTELAEVSQRLAAATRHERLHEAATAGARVAARRRAVPALPARGGRERAVRWSPPTRPARPGRGRRAARCCSSCSPAGATAATARDLWPEHEGDALLTTPLIASDEQLGLLCVLRPRRFRPGDEELLRALADQTAMGLERADLIARLTARDRVKGLFDALEGDAGDAAVAAAAPAGCDLARPHVVRGGRGRAPTGRRSRAGSPRGCAGATRPASSTRAATRSGPWCSCPTPAAAERVIAQCQAVGAAEGVALGVSAPARDVPETRQAVREAARAAQLARTLRPGGGALGYDGLGAYKYLLHLRVDDPPRDRHWTAVATLLDYDAQRRTALLDTLEEFLARRRSVVETARALFIHPNTLRQRLARIERLTGLTLESEDLLALELAVKLVRLDDARRRAGA